MIKHPSSTLLQVYRVQEEDMVWFMFSQLSNVGYCDYHSPESTNCGEAEAGVELEANERGKDEDDTNGFAMRA
ncbi:hypothetical protein LINGRAHAP2_LOCUS4365 [Linum grandiflorum]